MAGGAILVYKVLLKSWQHRDILVLPPQLRHLMF